MGAPAWVVGVDFGGTSVKAGLVDETGRVRARDGCPTHHRDGAAALIHDVAEVVDRLRARAGRHRVRAVGVGVPGLVDVARAVVHTLPNVPGWDDVPLARALAARVRLPVCLDNDVNLMALAEHRYGAARGTRNAVCLTVGTGVGGGLVLDGQLFRGAAFAAGEIGHIPVARTGVRCGCGSRGCLETYVGIAAIVRRARRRLHRGGSVMIRRWLAAGRSLTPALLDRAARHGDRVAADVFEETGQWLGLGLVGVVNLLNPERVVIGGGIARAGSRLIGPARSIIQERAMRVQARTVRVVLARLGTEAGVLGAAVLARDGLRRTSR